MKAQIYIEDCWIGTTNFQICDESMGAIIGRFIPNENYVRYQKQIQSKTIDKGIANISDFNFRIVVDERTLNPLGGIGITDFEDEIIIESAGNDQVTIEKIKRAGNEELEMYNG